MHHLRAEAGEFEHFVVGNFRELCRVWHQARIGGINSIDVRVNLAKVSLQRCRECNRRQIGAAATERGDLAILRLALETGDDDDVARVERVVNLLGRDVVDLRLRVNAIGDDASLGAGHGNRRLINGVQRDGCERNGLLFTRGEQHVHLAFARKRHDVLGQLDQTICHAAHRRNDDNNLVAALAIFCDAPGDVFNAVGIAHRGAAIFLNYQCHRFHGTTRRIEGQRSPKGRGRLTKGNGLKSAEFNSPRRCEL